MKNISLYTTKFFLYFLLIFAVSFLQFVSNASADGPHGWFIPVGDYLNDTLPAGCNPLTHAAVTISLVEMGTKNILNNPAGMWGVSVRDKNSDTEVIWHNFNTQKISDPICFDPENEVLRPIVYANSYYNRFEAVPFQPSENYSSNMRGYHFKGYVQLLSKDASDQRPFVVPLWPGEDVFEAVPDIFQVATYAGDNLSGAGSDVATTRIHLLNHDTNEYFTRISNTPGTVEVKDVLAPDVLSSGLYYWMTDQVMDGNVSFSRPGGPSWNLSKVSQSGMSSGSCFTVDSIPPQTEITYPTFVVTGDSVQITLNNPISDIYSGLYSTTIYVFEEDTGVFFDSVTINYGPEIISSANPEITMYGLDKGKTYKIYAITEDNIANETKSNEVIFNSDDGAGLVPPTVGSPTVTNITDTGADLGATITADGNSSLTRHGTCWSTDPDFNGQLCDDNANGILNTPYSYERSGMNAGTLIYFRGYAQNAAGLVGYSASSSFETTGTSIGVPTLADPRATNITENTADLGAEITDDGGSPIIRHGTCWSLNFDFSSQSCDNNSNGSVGIPFSYLRSNMPSDTDIFFRGYADNASGRDYSPTGNFRTLVGSAMVTDPELYLSPNVSTVRVGAVATLEWSMNNIAADLDCEIKGPSSFNYSFTHTYDAGLGETREGSVDTDPVTATQLYTFTCNNPSGSETFSTSTRIKVIGNSFEI